VIARLQRGDITNFSTLCTPKQQTKKKSEGIWELSLFPHSPPFKDDDDDDA
jgi:hypothetical protein